jgi:Uma2 family endonuclease
MSPELFESHNFIKVEVGFVVYGLIRPQRLGLFFGDRALFTNKAAGISTEPDAIYVSNESIESGRCKLLESARAGINKELIGSPDWILEVVSPTSINKDKEALRDAYFRAGVAEYWLIDALGDEVEFQILVPGGDGFAAVEPQDGWLASPTFHRSFLLTRVKDRKGAWQYTLQVHEE